MQTNIIRRLLLAAESGDAAAQFNLGVLCESRLDDNGYPIEGNRAEAIKWLLAAADQGLPRAQSKLAEMYAEGTATPENDIKACAWFLLATTGLAGIHLHKAQFRYERVSAARQEDLANCALGPLDERQLVEQSGRGTSLVADRRVASWTHCGPDDAKATSARCAGW